MESMENKLPSRVKVGVVGGRGYTGQELVGLLARHEGVELVFVTSRSGAGSPSPVPGISYSHPDEAPVDEVDLVFLCLPHGTAVPWVERLRGGPRIIDLTADHRPGSGREDGAVYGLAEPNRKVIEEADLVANPGCYPTGAILSLLPLQASGIVDPGRLTVINAASGTTGAGRTAKPELLFAEVAGNYKAYGEGNQHRHLKEIRILLPELTLFFQPHLLPVPRGILETIIVPVRVGVNAERVREVWRKAYEGSGAIEVLGKGIPQLNQVVSTDRLALGASDVDGVDPPVVTVVAALDNLGKGAAGQAIQNMNTMFGWPLEQGIRCSR